MTPPRTVGAITVKSCLRSRFTRSLSAACGRNDVATGDADIGMTASFCAERDLSRGANPNRETI